MQNHIAIYLRLGSTSEGTVRELLSTLRQTIESRGDVVAGVFTDDGRITGKGKNAGWRRLLNDLSDIHQIVLADAGDLPGRTVQDLLSILAALTQSGVSLAVPSLEIDTADGSAAVLELVRAYRRAKTSAAIKRGQEKARQQGRHIGRPPIPIGIRRRIMAALVAGNGVRLTARLYGVAPASVVAIRQEMLATTEQRAA